MSWVNYFKKPAVAPSPTPSLSNETFPDKKDGSKSSDVVEESAKTAKEKQEPALSSKEIPDKKDEDKPPAAPAVMEPSTKIIKKPILSGKGTPGNKPPGGNLAPVNDEHKPPGGNLAPAVVEIAEEPIKIKDEPDDEVEAVAIYSVAPKVPGEDPQKEPKTGENIVLKEEEVEDAVPDEDEEGDMECVPIITNVTSLASPESGNAEPRPKPTAKKTPDRLKIICWNCLGDHPMSYCPVQKNLRMIDLNRKRLTPYHPRNGPGRGRGRGRGHGGITRGFKRKRLTVKQQNMIDNGPSPGTYSDNLRQAMGLETWQLPLYIYRMRIYGYPPGWLEYARSESAFGLKYFRGDSDEGEANFSPLKEAGINQDLLISYAGFNCEAPPGTRDEHLQHGCPPFSEKDSLEQMLIKLGVRPTPPRSKPTPKPKPEESSEVEGIDWGYFESNNSLGLKEGIPCRIGQTYNRPSRSATATSTLEGLTVRNDISTDAILPIILPRRTREVKGGHDKKPKVAEPWYLAHRKEPKPHPSASRSPSPSLLGGQWNDWNETDDVIVNTLKDKTVADLGNIGDISPPNTRNEEVQLITIDSDDDEGARSDGSDDSICFLEEKPKNQALTETKKLAGPNLSPPPAVFGESDEDSDIDVGNNAEGPDSPEDQASEGRKSTFVKNPLARPTVQFVRTNPRLKQYKKVLLDIDNEGGVTDNDSNPPPSPITTSLPPVEKFAVGVTEITLEETPKPASRFDGIKKLLKDRKAGVPIYEY